MEETKESRYYSLGLFDDEVIEKIRANIKYIAEDGYECVDQLMAKPGENRKELIYCFNLGEDYAITHPHAKSAVRFLREDAIIVPYAQMEMLYPFFGLAQDLLIGLLVNDSYKLFLHEDVDMGSLQGKHVESDIDPTSMAMLFRTKREFPFEKPAMDSHKKHCIMCFLAGIRNVFKDELKAL